MSLESKLEKQAEEIMDRFGFEKVHAHMVEKNHRWVDGKELEVPSIHTLRLVARILLTKAIYHKDPCINIGTGGFMVYKMPWGLSLTFQLAWS